MSKGSRRRLERVPGSYARAHERIFGGQDVGTPEDLRDEAKEGAAEMRERREGEPSKPLEAAMQSLLRVRVEDGIEPAARACLLAFLEAAEVDPCAEDTDFQRGQRYGWNSCCATLRDELGS